MANLIGQYIHFDFDHYLRYGLRRTDYDKKPNDPNYKEPKQDWNRWVSAYADQKIILNQQANKMKNKYNRKKVINIENELNYYFTHGQNNVISPNNKLIENFIRKEMRKYISSSSQIDFKNLSVMKKNQTFQSFSAVLSDTRKKEIANIEKLKTYKTINGAEAEKEVNYATIQKRLNTLLSLRDELAGILGRKNPDMISLTNRIEKIRKIKDSIFKDTKKRRIDSAKGQNLIDEINFLINDLKVQTDSLSGLLAELYLFATNYLMVHGAIKGTNKIIDDMSKAFKQSKWLRRSAKGIVDVTIDPKIIKDLESLKIHDKQVKKTYKIGNDKDLNGLFTVSFTEDKVDIMWDHKGEEVPLSVKNYNLNTSNNIHLLSGASLIGLVQEYTTFVNHFLNVATVREGNATISDAPTNAVNNMKKMMKLTILFKALTGGVWGIQRDGTVAKSKSAELLVVNDSSAAKPRFKIYQMGDILNAVEKNMSLLNMNDELANLDIKNKWVPVMPDVKNSNQRITNILADIHKMKLSVSINKKTLSSI